MIFGTMQKTKFENDPPPAMIRTSNILLLNVDTNLFLANKIQQRNVSAILMLHYIAKIKKVSDAIKALIS